MTVRESIDVTNKLNHTPPSVNEAITDYYLSGHPVNGFFTGDFLMGGLMGYEIRLNIVVGLV